MPKVKWLRSKKLSYTFIEETSTKHTVRLLTARRSRFVATNQNVCETFDESLKKEWVGDRKSGRTSEIEIQKRHFLTGHLRPQRGPVKFQPGQRYCISWVTELRKLKGLSKY